RCRSSERLPTHLGATASWLRACVLLAMKTITFYSYKGGVGRTLVVANVAQYLAQFGLRVVVMDLDLEAPGLHHKFALGRPPFPHAPGVADYLSYFMDYGAPPPDLTQYVVSVPSPRGDSLPINLIPAGDAPAASYWEALSSIDWHYLLFSEHAPGVALFEDLKARIETELAPEYLLIDARTGMTETGGVATSLLADVVVTLTLDTREHVEGVRSVLRSVNKTRLANGDDPIQLEVALSRLSGADEEALQKKARGVLAFLNEPADDASETLSLSEVLVLHAEPNLQEYERLLIGGDVETKTEEVLVADYLDLFARFIPAESLGPHVQE